MKLARIALIGLLALTVGCATKNVTVTNTPTGVTSVQVDAWTSAINDLTQAQTFTHTALTTVVGLNRRLAFPDGPAYAATINGFGRAEQLEIEAAQFLKTVPNDWSQSTSTKILSYTNQILAQMQIALANGTVGSPNSASTITDMIGQIVAVIKLVQSLPTITTGATIFLPSHSGCLIESIIYENMIPTPVVSSVSC